MWVTHRFKALFVITVFFVGFLCITGCAIKKPDSEYINNHIKVFNVSLFALVNEDVLEGVSPRRESCISGYEFYYDDLDLVVSYRQNDRVWRITTRNKKTSMFGIAPDDSFARTKGKITQLGFSQGSTPYKFVKDWCLLREYINTNVPLKARL